MRAFRDVREFSLVNRLPIRLAISRYCSASACIEGGGSSVRLCNVEKRTVLSILKLAGEHCEQLLTEQIHNGRVRDLGIDEVWTFVRCK